MEGMPDARRPVGRDQAAVRGRGHRLPRALAGAGADRAPAPRRSARPTASTGAASCSRSRPRCSVTRRWATWSRSARASTTSSVGDRVIVPGTSECGVCFYCSIGRPDQCSETFDRGGIWPHVANRHNGQPVSAAGNVGGYSEMMNVTATQVFPVETDLPDQWLSLLGCGITTGLGRCSTSLRWLPGSSVAIVGCGHLGLWMVQAARLAQARTIIALDPIGWRREMAGTLGATHTRRPVGRGSDRRRAGAHRWARRRLRARGGDAGLGADAGGAALAPRRASRAHQRRARRRHGDLPAGGDRRAEPRDHQRPERQGADAARPAALHPHDGGRAGRRRSRSSPARTRSIRSTTPCTPRWRSATSPA